MSQPPFSYTHHHTLDPPHVEDLHALSDDDDKAWQAHSRTCKWWVLHPFYLPIPTHGQSSIPTSTSTSYHYHKQPCSQPTQLLPSQMTMAMAGGLWHGLQVSTTTSIISFLYPLRHVHAHTAHPHPHPHICPSIHTPASIHLCLPPSIASLPKHTCALPPL